MPIAVHESSTINPYAPAAIGLADERCNVINLVEQNSDLTTCTSLLTERGVYTLVAIYSKSVSTWLYVLSCMNECILWVVQVVL